MIRKTYHTINKRAQFSSSQTKTEDKVNPANSQSLPVSKVKPEQMSLRAHQHIQGYLRQQNRTKLEKNDLNAVLRLSQHLRVFGLLSAAGYVNQSNEQGGKTRERTVPVWESLLGQLINETNPPDKEQIMEQVKKMADKQPAQYMENWRRALMLSNHWNFWARAYAESRD
jgi:homoserine acetyltransferase